MELSTQYIGNPGLTKLLILDSGNFRLWSRQITVKKPFLWSHRSFLRFHICSTTPLFLRCPRTNLNSTCQLEIEMETSRGEEFKYGASRAELGMGSFGLDVYRHMQATCERPLQQRIQNMGYLIYNKYEARQRSVPDERAIKTEQSSCSVWYVGRLVCEYTRSPVMVNASNECSIAILS